MRTLQEAYDKIIWFLYVTYYVNMLELHSNHFSIKENTYLLFKELFIIILEYVKL